MKRLLYFCLFSYSLCLSIETSAQQIISAFGGESINGGIYFNSTLGELSILTKTDDEALITEGFHQPEYTLMTAIEIVPLSQISVYPNPSSDILNIEVGGGTTFDDLKIRLFNSTGTLLYTQTFSNSSITIDLSNFVTGIYFLEVASNESDKKGTITIIKI
jgi:hypothetical protein